MTKKTHVRIWAGKPFHSARKNVKLGTTHPVTGKPVTIEDDVDEIIGALKDKGIKNPESLTDEEKANFIAYYKQMNPLGDNPLPHPGYKRTKEDMTEAYEYLTAVKTEDTSMKKPPKSPKKQTKKSKKKYE